MQRRSGSGLTLALTSAATFGMSGIFATSLIDIGWTPGAAVVVRIALAAALLDRPGPAPAAGSGAALPRGRDLRTRGPLRRIRRRRAAVVLLQRDRPPVRRRGAAARVPRHPVRRRVAVAAPRPAAAAADRRRRRERTDRPGADPRSVRRAAHRHGRRAVGPRRGRRSRVLLRDVGAGGGSAAAAGDGLDRHVRRGGRAGARRCRGRAADARRVRRRANWPGRTSAGWSRSSASP